MKKVQFILGIISTLLGAVIMFEGSLFGDRTMSIAIVLGIVGICLITTSKPSIKSKKIYTI